MDQQNAIVSLNGQLVPLSEASISPLDRGFLFGDGIYEVVRYVQGRPFMLREHLNRLQEGLHGLQIRVEKNLLTSLPDLFMSLLEVNKLTTGEATVYLQITRGAAFPRSHNHPDPAVNPTVFVYAAPFTPHTALQKSGADAITVADVRWQRCNLKTVNLLPNIMARHRAAEEGIYSAVMQRNGFVTESPNANIFGVKDGRVFTHPPTHEILHGITRIAICRFLRELNIPLVEEPIRSRDLYELDELFFSGTTTDIQPIVRVDHRSIGQGRPGPITQKVTEKYKEALYAKESTTGQ
ncbi:MAG: aminotransferase class IV [Balneolaceae bacterium]